MDAKFIKQIPFFAPLSEDKIDVVLKEFQAKQYTKGDTIMHQGEKADGMYVVIFGEVEVVRDGTPIANISDGGFFGEMALAADEPRSATINVISDNLSTFFLSTESFKKIKEELGDEVRQEILKRITQNYS